MQVDPMRKLKGQLLLSIAFACLFYSISSLVVSTSLHFLRHIIIAAAAAAASSSSFSFSSFFSTPLLCHGLPCFLFSSHYYVLLLHTIFPA
jgi:hypothetical protein